jgi:hypothetical protein
MEHFAFRKSGIMTPLWFTGESSLGLGVSGPVVVDTGVGYVNAPSPDHVPEPETVIRNTLEGGPCFSEGIALGWGGSIGACAHGNTVMSFSTSLFSYGASLNGGWTLWLGKKASWGWDGRLQRVLHDGITAAQLASSAALPHMGEP